MGRFIAIDGLDGSGKSTQYEMLVSYLESRGVRVRRLKFPVYESDSSTLVRMYLSGALGSADSTNAYAASMFFAADRYVSYVSDWRADYSDPGTVIVADRYTTANLIHQLSKLPRETWQDFSDWLYDFEFSKLTLPRPDLVIYLENTPQLARTMIDVRGHERDVHERDESFMMRCHEAGRWASETFGWHTVCVADGDSMRPRDDIFSEIKRAVCGMLDMEV